MLMARSSMAVSSSSSSSSSSMYRLPIYTCDELTPDLCDDLIVEEGQVHVYGIPVTYWNYTSASAGIDNNNNNDQNVLPKWPIIAIHGGPSFTHHYMLPLKQQACRGRTIIFYDQAGCGKSRPPPPPITTPSTSTAPGDEADEDDSNTSAHEHIDTADEYPWLLDPLYYATVELPALIRHLGLGGAVDSNHRPFHLVGNSWGTALAQLYALEANKKGNDETRSHLASMVLSGPFSDSQSYIQAQWEETDGNLGGLPPFVQERIRHLEASEAYQSAEYQAVNQVLSAKFTLRTQPPPDCWRDAVEQANTDIYTRMQGPSEFTMAGVLADFNVTGRLHELQELPVLLTHGKYDTMRPSIVQAMQDALPIAERLYMTKSGHVSMIDEPGAMNDGMADFYDRVEARPFLSRISPPPPCSSTSGISHTDSTSTTTKNDYDWKAKASSSRMADMQATSYLTVRSRIPMVLYMASLLMAMSVGWMLADRRGRTRSQIGSSGYIHLYDDIDVEETRLQFGDRTVRTMTS